MKKTAVNNPVLEKDIMRYKKNKLAANLALGGLACDCIYFMFFYAWVGGKLAANVQTFYYNWSIAFDVIYNLFFLLTMFLCSEEVKNYKRKLFVLQLVIGVLQIARIFWLPLTGLIAGALEIGSFMIQVIALALSGALVIASAVIGYLRSVNLEKFEKSVAAGEVDLDAALKETEGGEANA